MRLCFAFATVLAALCGVSAHSADDRKKDTDRSAWRYVDKELTVVIRRSGDGEWTAERSDGKRPLYREVERKPDEVTLQNKETKLFVRLTADRAFWRRPADADWTPWVKGGWIADAASSTSEQVIDPSPNATRRIKLAYFVPQGRKATANYQRKIRVVMAVVNELYRSDLKAKGYKTEGLRFWGEDEADVHLVRGEREARRYNNAPTYDADEQWRRLLPEIRAKVGDTQKQVIVVFAETYDDGPAEILWPGVIARGAYFSADGGLAVFSAHLLRDEFMGATPDAQRQLFFDKTPVQGRKAWGQKMNSPRGAIAEAGIGAVAHELGHALGLPHDRRDDARDIMGNGFRNLHWNSGGAAERRVRFSEDNARLLMSSRCLAADLDVTDEQPPKVEAKLLPGANGVSVKAADDRGLRAFVLVDRNKGSVVAGRPLKGRNAEFREVLPASKGKAAAAHLQLIVTDMGGNLTRFTLGGPRLDR